MIFGFPLSILAFKRKIKNSHLATVNHYKGLRANACQGDFEVLGSNLPQINTTYLFHMQNAWRTLRRRCGVNFRRVNKP